jgi:hypothetical protein
MELMVDVVALVKISSVFHHASCVADKATLQVSTAFGLPRSLTLTC